MTRTATPPSSAVGTERLPGPDVVRAVALIGVVLMNFHGYLILRGGRQGDGAVDRFFDPWTGPLSTRFAATFVLVAGVGVTLLTRRAVTPVRQPALVSARRWTLIRRGLTLYGAGLLFDTIWPGTILPFYGAMFVLGAFLFTLRARWLVTVGAGRRAGRCRHRLVGPRTRARRAPHGLAVRARWSVAADPAVRRRRQRHPPAAAMAGLLLRRHGARARPDDELVAAGGDRRRTDAVRAGHDDLRCLGDRSTERAVGEHGSVRPWAAVHGERAGHGAGRLRRDLLAGRPVHDRRSDRAAAPRRGDEPDLVHRPRPRVQPRRRLARLGPADRPGHRPDGGGRVLGGGHRRRQLVAPAVRHRPGRVAVPPARR